MAAFSEEIVEIKCDPHKILNNTYLYRFFCSKFKSFHNDQLGFEQGGHLFEIENHQI